MAGERREAGPMMPIERLDGTTGYACPLGHDHDTATAAALCEIRGAPSDREVDAWGASSRGVASPPKMTQTGGNDAAE